MKKIFFFVFILGGAFIFANGQTIDPATPQTSQPTVGATRGSRTYNPQREQNTPTDRTQGTIITDRNPAYRKPSKEDLQLVAPDNQLTAKYEALLRQPKTGLIRLLSEAGCQENTNLVSADEFCLKYKNLFGASTFSFRTETYTLGRFADVVYKNGVIYSYGKMTLGFITDLGTEVSLSEVSAKTAGAKYVFDFAPPEKLSLIEGAALGFQKGVRADGFTYRKFHNLEENHVYLMRSVAYKRREQVERNQVVYDDLTNDNRKDVIVVFQVVRLSNADGVTILWKELQRKDVAKINMKEK
jgi:hypothetical protein